MPTIRRCCIIGCMSNSRQNPQLQFFQFPRPENPFHKMWKEACHASLRRILPFKKPVVCAMHFDPSCLGGRRLTSNAVPSLRLEVPSNLEAVEQQAMVEEIERSRKCAFINAVVYEWLVRANTNPSLRGSITHGMIKEKAENARQVIGSSSFVADNRWLNRFRETHLAGFAQKLATNQLKPIGSSLWIPDIVQDLQHLFPPTSAERVAKLDEMPEQYLNYMQQYGEYEEDEDDLKEQTYQEQQQQQHYHMQQQQQQQHHQQHQAAHHHPHMQSAPHHYGHHPAYDPYGQHPGYNNYTDYYYEQRQQQQQQQHHHHQQQQQMHHAAAYAHRPNSISPPQQHNQPLPAPSPHAHSQSPQIHQRSSPFQQPAPPQLTPNSLHLQHQQQHQQQPHHQQSRTSPIEGPLLKRPKIESPDEEVQEINGDMDRSNTSLPQSPAIEENLTDENDANQNNSSNSNNANGTTNTKLNGTSTPNGHIVTSIAPTLSPKSLVNGNCNGNGGIEVNGHSTPIANSNCHKDELSTYAQALEYLKPLEDFVLFKENFRAIGLLSQLEAVLRKGEKTTLLEG